MAQTKWAQTSKNIETNNSSQRRMRQTKDKQTNRQDARKPMFVFLTLITF